LIALPFRAKNRCFKFEELNGKIKFLTPLMMHKIFESEPVNAYRLEYFVGRSRKISIKLRLKYCRIERPMDLGFEKDVDSFLKGRKAEP